MEERPMQQGKGKGRQFVCRSQLYQGPYLP